MTDLIKRLRDIAEEETGYGLRNEAADALEAANARIKELTELVEFHKNKRVKHHRLSLDELIKKILRYDRDTGLLYWTESRGGNRAGDVAGRINPVMRYIQVQIRGNGYPAHRIAWFLEYGYWPPECVDHIDGNRSNNRIANLRLATIGQNNCNVGVHRNNSSGVKGVGYHKASGKWSAYIAADRKQRYLGLFLTIEEASAAVRAAREELHGEFANHG